ncbi:COP9 signalosome complex subunit 8 [Frankliniella occidentalis]|uniref:COP9 signalosome complex subunit 8 n=1 Tax=Frankliniella occidentalis TaxID=133901 RepID=A0A6J1T3B4_FRAOC|nr:COP9 signalosome complex subunit 8 [Frankliniella occidentalis]
MIAEDLISTCAELERLELISPTGEATAQEYAQLLAIYLCQSDLCNAKFLWKRIPTSLKNSHDELSLIWKVGQCMWKRDYPAAYSALQVSWSDNVRHIMLALQDELRTRAVDLIANAYSSITVSDLSAMAGINDREAERLSNARGWIIDAETEMVHPVRPPPSSHVTTSSEGQLNKLTDYVSFLEN